MRNWRATMTERIEKAREAWNLWDDFTDLLGRRAGHDTRPCFFGELRDRMRWGRDSYQSRVYGIEFLFRRSEGMRTCPAPARLYRTPDAEMDVAVQDLRAQSIEVVHEAFRDDDLTVPLARSEWVLGKSLRHEGTAWVHRNRVRLCPPLGMCMEVALHETAHLIAGYQGHRASGLHGSRIWWMERVSHHWPWVCTHALLLETYEPGSGERFLELCDDPSKACSGIRTRPVPFLPRPDLRSFMEESVEAMYEGRTYCSCRMCEQLAAA